MMSRSTTLFVAAALVTAAACSSEDPTAPDPTEPTFEAVVEQVLVPKCTFGQCHSSTGVAASLDLTPDAACDMLVDQPACLFPDRTRVIPGNPDDSFFFHKVAGQGIGEMPSADCGFGAAPWTNALMPFGAAELTDDELRIVHGWIAAGAQCEKKGKNLPSIKSITASTPAPLAGQNLTFTVELDRAAPEGGLIVTLETNRDLLSMPVKVVVPAGETEVDVDAFALRPTSRFSVRARSEQHVRDAVIRIGGLEVAEVLTNPIGPNDQLQWIKLHNRTSVPIDLSNYRLQAGARSYDDVGLPLTGAVAAGSCVVIGGPLANGMNSEPIFSQPIDFAPDLSDGALEPAGFAVFDPAAVPLGGAVTPVDALVIGGNNSQMLDPDGQIATPGCLAPPEGMSALRSDNGCKAVQLQPRSCP